MDLDNVRKKIKEYESFLEDSLKRDLNEIQQLLKGKVEKYREWEQLKNTIKTLNEFKENDCDMNIRVGLGCGVQVAAEVSDYNRIYIDIGLGHLLQMDCEEADKYSDIRLRSLKKDIDHFRQLAVQVKVNIKMVLLGINEMQSLLADSVKNKS